ncbi:MAG: hypothetical protein ACYTF1_12875 [Planctomycetota bacterium]|jgi:hypothetical protein
MMINRKVSSWIYGVIWTYVLSAVMMVGCDRKKGLQQPTTMSAQAQPMLSISHYPALPKMGEPLVYGLVLAVWPDRRVVRVTDKHAIGKSYIEGHMSDEDWEILENLLREYLGIKDTVEDQVVIDAACLGLIVRYGHSRSETYASLPFKDGSIIARVQELIMSVQLKGMKDLQVGCPDTRPE